MIGLVLAGVSGVLAVVGWVSMPSTGSKSRLPTTFGAFVANIAALIFLGIPTGRASSLPGRWRFLPLAMGIATFPLTAVGGALESINERLLELPLVVLGLAWMWMGYLVWPCSRPNAIGSAPIA